jgi:hypothetical protein
MSVCSPSYSEKTADQRPEVLRLAVAERMLGVGHPLGHPEAGEQEDLVEGVGDRVRGLGQHRARPADQPGGQLGHGDRQVGRERDQDRALALGRHLGHVSSGYVGRAVERS